MKDVNILDAIPRLFIPVPRELRSRANPREKPEYCHSLGVETTPSVLVEVLFNAGVVSTAGDSFDNLCKKVTQHKDRLDLSYVPYRDRSWSMGKRGLLKDIERLQKFVARFSVLAPHRDELLSIKTKVSELTDRMVTFNVPNHPGRDVMIEKVHNEILEMQILMTPGLATGELSNRYVKFKASLAQQIGDINAEMWSSLKNNAVSFGLISLLSTPTSKQALSSIFNFDRKRTRRDLVPDLTRAPASSLQAPDIPES